MKINPPKTLVTFLLDESGSMETVKRKTIEGINEYIGSLKQEDSKILMNLTTFNSSGIKTLFNYIPIEKIPELTEWDYYPDFRTPLYDAIGTTINKTDDYITTHENKVNVIFTIMTDGLNNASLEYSQKMIFHQISEKQNKDWLFTFLGSNQDAWEVGQGIGITKDFSANYRAESPDIAMKVESERFINAKRTMDRGFKVDKYYRSSDREKLDHI